MLRLSRVVAVGHEPAHAKNGATLMARGLSHPAEKQFAFVAEVEGVEAADGFIVLHGHLQHDHYGVGRRVRDSLLAYLGCLDAPIKEQK